MEEDAALGLDSSAACIADEQCSDGLFCNGREVCDVDGSCSTGEAPDCDTCVEDVDLCVTE